VTHAYNPSTREAVRKEDLEFEANLGYIRRLCLQEKKKKDKPQITEDIHNN
jgi:hypothetical protein